MLGLQHRFNLAVLRDEPWDPERHPDTVSWTRVVRGEPTYGKNRNVVERGHYDRSEDYSVQRLHFIYRDGKEVQESWSKHFPEQGTEFRLLQKLIITDRNDLPDGSPYLQQDGENCHPYLRHFRTVSRKFEKPGEQGWQLVEHADHTATYAVAVCTKVFVSDDRIRVGMKVADIADCPEDEEEEDRRGQAKIEWLDDGDLAEVWSAKFSQVPLSAEA